MKVCVVVIWFNPNQKNWEVIENYLPFIDKCIIVDNSNIDNKLLIKTNTNKVIYISNLQNLGIAEALNIGCKKADSLKYKWVLTMDDDSFFDKKNYNNYLEEIKNIIKKDKNAVSFSPNFSMNKKNGYSKTNRIISSGNLVSLDVLKSLNYYRKELFLYEVDIDLSYRIFLKGYNLYEIHNVNMNHNVFDSPLKIKIFRKTYNIRRDDSPESKYYLMRNGLLMNKEYFSIRKNNFFTYYLFPLRLFLKVIFFEHNKKTKLKYLFKAISDFKKGRFGKCPLSK